MKIFDNIGCEFSYNSTNNSFTLLGALPGYSSLSLEDAGFSIPYLARNIDGKHIEYELGVGYLERIDNKLILTDKQVSLSSNNNHSVDFNKNGLKQFYLFVHNVNFDNAFNNIFIENKDFNIEPRKSVYIVDTSSSGYVVGLLPDPNTCEAVELEFKTLGDGSLNLSYQDFKVILDHGAYTKLVSTGKEWVELKDSSQSIVKNLSILSSTDSSFNALSNPSGEDRSLQFNNNGLFDDASLYQGSDGKLLFGSSTENLAKHIIPSTGNYNTVFNQTKENSGFIIHGLANNPGYPSRNLYFSSDGKFGINMPSGVNTGTLVKPSTILHVFNTLCKEGIRLENRANCYPADITLYDNPYTFPRADGSGIARIVFAGKDGSSNKIDFATIETKIKSSSNKQGQLDISVVDGGVSKTTLSSSANKTLIKTDSAIIDIDNNNINISGALVNISGSNIGIGTNAISNIDITGITTVNTKLKLPFITPVNALLSVNSNYEVIATTGFKIPSLSSEEESIVTAKADGTVSAGVPRNAFWPYEFGEKIGGKDVIWERYPYRTAQICLNKTTREIDIDPAPLEEYSVGDQIAIFNKSTYITIYRFISDIIVTNDNITGLLLDQAILISGNSANLRIYSVSKGGVLTNTVYTSGIASDATSIVLSTRPGVDTVFNTKRKNIDFTVYGTEDVPALNIRSHAAFGDNIVGKYFKYATQLQASNGIDIPPLAISLNNLGIGPANSTINNSANINNSSSTWLAKVSAVGNNGRPSYYGTYDQNGNVYEWIEDDNKISSYQSYQYVCGGSWRTFDNDAIRGYIATPRYSGLDDVGFRICSKAGYSNPDINNLLSLLFVGIHDINNPADSSSLYTEFWNNRFGDSNDQPNPITKNNLGTVNYPYKISTYEITNYQYAIFLNSVATGVSSISGLYKVSMSSNNAGGIMRSGDGSITPYSYHIKTNMENMPVVFVDYVSSIRFINWLSNGAPSGTGIPEGVTEFGSYAIDAGPGGADLITKNRDQNYWLPSLNEWHKAAYYAPIDNAQVDAGSSLSAVTVRKLNAFEYSQDKPFVSGTGAVASLSVGGLTYTDTLKIGNEYIQDSDRVYHPSINFSSSVIAGTGTSYIVSQDIIKNTIGKNIFRADKTILCQPLLITTGVANGVDDRGGILITASGFNYLDNEGNPIEGGLFMGQQGGYLFKDPHGTNTVSSSGKLTSIYVEDEGDYYPSLSHTNGYEIIHNNGNALLSSSPWLTVGDNRHDLDVDAAFDQATNSYRIININGGDSTSTGGSLPILCTDRIFIGPSLKDYAGSILTHNGDKAAYWQPNEFLRAPGASWTRYGKRAVEFIISDEDSNVRFLKFVALDPSKGGTGPVTLQNIKDEFNFNETIAIYNQSREVTYVKVANVGLVDSRDRDINSTFFVDEDALLVSVCPGIDIGFALGSVLTLPPDDPDSGRLIGYAFSVQKGAYFRMGLEPDATDRFACLTDDTNSSEYRFKPGTSNTISTRPNIHTVFNTLADDIDFVIYGYRKTLFTRYEPEWFNQDAGGIPTGLNPAFRVHAKIDNSCIGSIESGVHRITVGNNGIATGILPDLKSKVTINTHEPYVISSITGIKSGVILPANTPQENLILEKMYGSVIPITGLLMSGISPLANYADLTIGGTTYTDKLITKDMILGPLWTGEVPVPYELSLTQKIYAPNYPLTINALGQIVSLIPPPSPEPPSAPINLVAEPKNNSIVLTWNIPEDDGGETIIGYIIELSVDGGITWNDNIVQDMDSVTKLPAIADRNTIKILNNPDVINNTSYSFRLRAYNSVGLGTLSDTVSATPLESLGPSVPRNLEISVGENSSDIRTANNIILAWSAPSVSPTPDEYVIQYWVYNTLNNTDLKDATWTSATNSPINSLSTQIEITGLDTKPLIYFSVQSKTSNGSLSARALYASLGTNPDPRPVGSRPTIVDTNQYNFGSVIFVGSCS